MSSYNITVAPDGSRLLIPGLNNDKKPRQDFADKIAAESVEEFLKTAEQYIWLDAYAANNPRSDYHWMGEAVYAEALRRGDESLYERAWHRASGM